MHLPSTNARPATGVTKVNLTTGWPNSTARMMDRMRRVFIKSVGGLAAAPALLCLGLLPSVWRSLLSFDLSVAVGAMPYGLDVRGQFVAFVAFVGLTARLSSRFICRVIALTFFLLKPVAALQPYGIEMHWPHKPAVADSGCVPGDV